LTSKIETPNVLYGQRKKAVASSVDERIRNAERNRLYRQRKKADAVMSHSARSISDAVSSRSISAACPSDENITYDSAHPWTSMRVTSRSDAQQNNATVEQEDATEDENEVTVIYKYSDATFNLISRILSETTADPSRLRGDETFHGIMARAYVRDERGYRARWAMADNKFDGFSSNEFGSACSVCDRLWFASDVRPVPPKHFMTLQSYFRDEDVGRFVVCSNCYRHLESGRMAPMSRWYGFRYPPKPTHLPPLDISARLVSPRLRFMQLRRLQHDTGTKAIIGQIVNVAVDVGDMIVGYREIWTTTVPSTCISRRTSFITQQLPVLGQQKTGRVRYDTSTC
jgi:hypothetical protein